MYENDQAYGACGVYKIVDYVSFQYEFVKDIPLHECPAIFGFTVEDTPNVINWTMDRIKEAKARK